MNSEQRFNFLRDWYKREEDRKMFIDGHSYQPATVSTLLFTAVFYMLTKFNFKTCCDFEKDFFLLFVGVAVVFGVISIYHTARGYLPPAYTALTKADELFKYQEVLEEYFANEYEQNQDNSQPSDAANEFQKQISNKLIRITSKYIELNDLRMRYIYKAKLNLIYAILALLISSLPFITNQVQF